MFSDPAPRSITFLRSAALISIFIPGFVATAALVNFVLALFGFPSIRYPEWLVAAYALGALGCGVLGLALFGEHLWGNESDESARLAQLRFAQLCVGLPFVWAMLFPLVVFSLSIPG